MLFRSHQQSLFDAEPATWELDDAELRPVATVVLATGPEGASDGGKGKLFWRGYEQGAAQGGSYASWMATAFQHGGRWDVNEVCCVSLFSYGLPQFSTSLGTGDVDENIAGYLVEFGG